MPDVEFVNLFIVAVVALVVPLILGFLPRLRVPPVVLEIVVGVAIGPAGLGWVQLDLPVQIVALLGLAFLLFLAGLEIDAHRLRGRVLRLAGAGYVVTVVLGLLVGLGLQAAGLVTNPVLVAIALSATSLGLVVPALKDAGQADSPVGQTTIAASSVADFSAIVLLSLLFSSSSGGAGSRLLLIGLFAGLVMVVGVGLLLAGRSMRLGSVLARLQDTTSEIRVRAAVALMVGLVAAAEAFGLESILGAFLAGALVSALDRDTSSHPQFRVKLEAIGYGFLVPVFFVTSGARLDVSGLLASPSALALVPLFLLALLLVRGAPALLYLRLFGRREVVSAGLLQATSLPFIVTATQIGVLLGVVRPVVAAALVSAGLLSVLIFPTIALALMRRDQREPLGAD